MNTEYTAGIKRDYDWWIGWIEEIPGINCQEKSKEKLHKSLSETLKEGLKMNRQNALAEAGKGYEEERIAVVA